MAAETRSELLMVTRELDGLAVDLSPLQGLWLEAQYLALTNQTNHLIEFTDGELEFLPMPTERHQIIMLLLYELFKRYVQPRGGRVLVAGMRVRICPGSYREPDVLLMRDMADPRRQNDFWRGADLVLEVVSPGDSARDLERKPLDYAEAGIPEYWIVNPLDETVTVLTLAGAVYVTHGVFRRGDEVTSVLLEGFAVAVDAVFDAQ
jgi:Uma2 family endonuclease